MKSLYFRVFILLVVVYIVLTFALPADPQVLSKYGISSVQAKLLNLTIVGPLTLIYLVALKGFLRIHSYSRRIRETKEGIHFNNLSGGLMVLAFSLPINSIISAVASYMKYEHVNFYPVMNILRIYMTLIFAAVSIYFIAKGAEGLAANTTRRRLKISASYALAGPIILASVYTWLITLPENSALDNPYQNLPDWLLILTLAIPYTLVWSIGVRAASQLFLYQKSIKGVIYKQAFDNLSKGLGVLIATSIFIQLITTLSEQLNRLNLTPLLLIVYLLVMLYAVGYGLVASGAKKLKKIEEV